MSTFLLLRGPLKIKNLVEILIQGLTTIKFEILEAKKPQLPLAKPQNQPLR